MYDVKIIIYYDYDKKKFIFDLFFIGIDWMLLCMGNYYC